MEQLSSPEQRRPGRKVPLLDLLRLFEHDPEYGERITAVVKAREKADLIMARECLEFLQAQYNEFAGPIDKQLIPHYPEKIQMLQDAVDGKSGMYIQQSLKEKGLSGPKLRASMKSELMILIPGGGEPQDELAVVPPETLLDVFDGKNQLDPYRTAEALMLVLGADRYQQQVIAHHINPASGEFEIHEELLAEGLETLREEFYEYDLEKQKQFYNGNSNNEEARDYNRRRMLMSLLVGQYHEAKNFKEIVDYFEAPYKNASIDIDLARGIHRDVHVICFDMLEFALKRSKTYTPQKLLLALRSQ